MEAKKEMRNQMIKIGVLVVAIVTLGISLTYAYYSANLKGESDISSRDTAKFDISSTLTGAPAINNSKMTLIDADKVASEAQSVSFAVTNSATATVSGRYFVYLTDIQLSKNLYSKYFKWELLRQTNTGLSTIQSGNFAAATRSDTPVAGEAENVVTTVQNIALNTVALEIPVNKTDNLVFRIWLENDPNQNQVELTNGTFQGKLKIEASPLK